MSHITAVNDKFPRIPLPPRCAIVDGDVVTYGEHITIDSSNGETMSGKLQLFSPNNGKITLLDDFSVRFKDIKIEDILKLSFPKPRLWIRAELPDGCKQESLCMPTDQIDYVVNLKNGESLNGNTFGFHTEATGIFLYPTFDDNHYTIIFIPNGAVANHNFGKAIGQILVNDNVIEQEDLNIALDIQKENREKPIGEYLRVKAVCSREELEDILAKQKKMNSVKLGEILIAESMITEQQLHDALQEQAKNRKILLGQILLSLGLITIADLQNALAKKMGIPFVDLRQFKIDLAVLSVIPEDIIRKYEIMPLFFYQKRLVVAIENPLDVNKIDAFKFSTGCQVESALASREDILWAINGYFQVITMEQPDVVKPDSDVSLSDFINPAEEEEPERDIGEVETEAGTSVVVKMVDKIIIDAFDQGASDIHIEPRDQKKKLMIRFRKDGSLINYHEVPISLSRPIVSRIKIMCRMDISEKRKPQDGKINFRRPGENKIELRVVTIPTVGNYEDVVIRILNTGEPPSLEKLNFSEWNLERIRMLGIKPYGMIIVCGPTGAGKTTSLHSLLKEINTGERKIWTIEDPVEITQEGLRQVQINLKIGIDFASAIRTFLRADPDVIMLGEMRDQITAKTGIEASLTGHLVLSTLHTNSAPETVTRLLDMGIETYNFADALLGILAQRLTKKLCIKCRHMDEAQNNEIEILVDEYCSIFAKENSGIKAPSESDIYNLWNNRYAGGSGIFTLFRRVGCAACANTGYSGRIALHELLVAGTPIKRLIINRAPVSEIQSMALSEGMRTLKQDGIEKVLQGHTDIHQVRAVCP